MGDEVINKGTYWKERWPETYAAMQPSRHDKEDLISCSKRLEAERDQLRAEKERLRNILLSGDISLSGYTSKSGWMKDSTSCRWQVTLPALEFDGYVEPSAEQYIRKALEGEG